MAIEADYLGMQLSINDFDIENTAYFRYASAHDFHLQQCTGCQLLRYPPATRCVWCANPEACWVPVEGKGTVHSYCEVHHAIQPQFKPYTPYLVLLVDLDTQRDTPNANEAIRVIGNLVLPDGTLAPPGMVQRVGIGTRVRMVFTDVAPGLSLPQWTIDETADMPGNAWRYPEAGISQ